MFILNYLIEVKINICLFQCFNNNLNWEILQILNIQIYFFLKFIFQLEGVQFVFYFEGKNLCLYLKMQEKQRVNDFSQFRIGYWKIEFQDIFFSLDIGIKKNLKNLNLLGSVRKD